MTISSLATSQPIAVRRASAAAAAPAPRVVARAQGGDPLPGFPDARAYQNYVINLVSQTRQLEREVVTAAKIAGEGKPNDPTVLALRERLDATKLQLKILRDDMPIPAAWTRWQMLGGEGFDKDKFWREQVEVIPGKPVAVNPEPPKPAARPAAPAPSVASLPTIQLPSEPADARVAQLLRMALSAHQGGFSSAAADAFAKATQACPTAADATAVFLTAHQKGYSTSAANAAARATSLATDSATNLAIGLTVHQKGYSTSAANAFNQAIQQAPSQAQALQIALSVHQKGYSSAAADAFARATRLSGTADEAMQVAENARKKGYSTSAANAMKRALDLQ